MLVYKDFVGMASEKTGVHFVGLESKKARIRNGHGCSLKDILGWDVVVKSEDGECYEFYVAQPPLIGMTQPVPVKCKIGIVPFDGYKIDIGDAIKIFHSGDWGEDFNEVMLSWPFTFPPSDEPYWYFVSDLGFSVIIGAISGQIKNYHSKIRLLYAAPQGFEPVCLYMAKPSGAVGRRLYEAVQEADQIAPLYMAKQCDDPVNTLYSAPSADCPPIPPYGVPQGDGPVNLLYGSPIEPDKTDA